MMAWREKAIRDAIVDFKKVKDILKNQKELEKSFRARARDLPSSVSTGLLPTLTYYYSQTDWEEIKKILGVQGEGRVGELVGRIGELKCAYGLCLYLALRQLFQRIDDPTECFLEITRWQPTRLALAKTKLVQYLLEIKKLAEAELEGG